MSGLFRTTLNSVPIEIDLDQGSYSFFGLPAVSFWLNPSLYRMLAPLVKETGSELARLLIAYESSRGTEEDYKAMVTQLGPTFSEGFLAWGRAVGVAGWGRFELPQFDPQHKRATVRVSNAWELKAQAGMDQQWGCPFLQGKLIGIFAHALAVSCWADERIIDAAHHVVEFSLYASPATIAGEIERLRLAHQEAKQSELAELARKVAEKQQTILQMSTPVVRLWEGILLLPLVGQLDAQRAAQLTQNVLSAITEHRSTEVIIDITGVPFVDSYVAKALILTVQAARLLGVECMLVGISAEVAQTLVRLGADLSRVRTFSTLEAGLTQALASQSCRIVRVDTGSGGTQPLPPVGEAGARRGIKPGRR
jgi:rsbT co-antagonist protein RsbR